MSEAAEDAALLVAAITQMWPGIADLLDGGRHEFESALLIHLRAVDAALGIDLAADERLAAQVAQPAIHRDPEAADEALRTAQNALLALFQTQPRAYQRLLTTLGELVGTVRRGTEPPPIPGSIAHQRYLEIPVLYGTDRAAAPAREPGKGDWFGGERGEPSYGVVWVSVPDDHRMAALEKPRWWRLQFRPDPTKHVVALGVEPLARPDFRTRATDAVATAARREALIFIHGYNVTFVDAARRAAQIAYDLNFDGLPMLYSWPSEGSTLRYAVDENNARWATPHFGDYLRLALTEIGADRVHVVAHSMGNRVLADALVHLWPEDAQRLGQVVFAAPDVDAAVFTQLAAQLGAGPPARTLYASSQDKALKASQLLAKYPRAGQSEPDIVVVAGVDTIDATDLDTGLMSHSYFGDRTSILSDIFALLRGAKPDQRFGLALRTNPNGLRYWIFKPRSA